MSGIPPFRPPPGFRDIAARLEASGHEAWAVGGAVRDALLSRSRSDWDMATDATPTEVRALFRRTVPIGIEHGTVGVFASEGPMFEVTTFRLDVKTDGRHAVVRFATSVDEDLARRDFTINAIAWRPATDELRDPHGGRADLAAGRLRAVGDPTRRFAEDYLRVLRGMRFAGAYDLEVDAPTRAAMAQAASRLARLSAERVREELLKVLAADRPSRSLTLYRDLGALEIWYPEVAARARGTGWTSTLAAVDALPPHRAFLRLIRFLLITIDPLEPGPQPESGAESVLRRLKFSNADTRRGLHLVRHHLPLVHPADSSAQVRMWLHEVGEEHARDLFRLHFADARAAGDTRGARGLTVAWSRVHDELVRGSPLGVGDLAVDGTDLLELGLPPGPLVGLMLEELLAQVLEAPEANEREELLRRAGELVRLGQLDRLREGSP